MPAKRAQQRTVSRRVFGHGKKPPCRVGLYARVSTHDQQTLPLQNRAMRDYAARRGWAIVIEVKEVGSGASVRELRQNLSVYLDRVKSGEVLEVTERGHAVALFTPLPRPATALAELVAVGRATAAAGDLLALGPPLGRRPRRRAGKALDELRQDER